MRTLVCGGRDFSERVALYQALDIITFLHPITYLIHGDARGADRLASYWARLNKIKDIPCPADWDLYGVSAGPIRNRYMLDTYEPEHVIAFDGGRGTRDMIQVSKSLGIPTSEVSIIREEPSSLSIYFKISKFMNRKNYV